MKLVLMKKTPKITDVHQQSLVYQNHKKKLQKIRQQRRTFLGYDTSRINQIQAIKMTKSRSFANKFNQNYKDIQKNNDHLLNKLLDVKNRANTYRGGYNNNNENYYLFNNKAMNRSLSSNKSNQHSQQMHSQNHLLNLKNINIRQGHNSSLIKNLIKKQIKETNQENKRFLDKLQKIQSPLSAKKFNSQYLKTEKIRKRLQKYTQNDDKISLKSERSYQNMKRSNVSMQSIMQKNHRQRTIQNQEKLKSMTIQNPRKISASSNLLNSKKSYNFVNHYKKDEILNNRIDIRMDKQINSARKEARIQNFLKKNNNSNNNILNNQKLAGIKFKNTLKDNSQRNSNDNNFDYGSNSFLTLQPHKKNTLPIPNNANHRRKQYH